MRGITPPAISVAFPPLASRTEKPTNSVQPLKYTQPIYAPCKYNSITMQIQVKCGCTSINGAECMEWAILELQGTVEVQPELQNQLQNLHIGDLCRSSTQDKYLFTVGYHQLEGKKVPLKKPLLVLRKKNSDRMGVESHLNIPETKSSKVELEVVGIIKQRILFKTRPKALISKPEVKEKKVRTLDAIAG